MKKFAWIILLIVCPLTLSVFSSCSDDDDDNPGGNNQIVGLWESVNLIEWEKCDGKFIYGNDTEEPATDRRDEFKADGTIITWRLENGLWEKDLVANYTLTNNNLIILEDGYSESFNLVTLNETTLIVEGRNKYTEDGKQYEDYVRRKYRRIN